MFFIFGSHAHWNVTVNVFETLSVSTFSLQLFVFLFFVCRCLILTTHSHPFHSSSDPHTSTTHSSLRRDVCQPFFHSFFDFSFGVLICVVLERSIYTCFQPQLHDAEGNDGSCSRRPTNPDKIVVTLAASAKRTSRRDVRNDHQTRANPAQKHTTEIMINTFNTPAINAKSA